MKPLVQGGCVLADMSDAKILDLEPATVIPAARTEGLLCQQVGEDLVLYDTKRHRAISLDAAAASIWKACDGIRNVEQISQANSLALNAVWSALLQLDRDELFVTSIFAHREVKWTRREMIRRLAIAAAVSTPVVAAITVPKAAEAGSCRPSGAPCTTSAQCCSTLCVTGTCA